LGSVILHGNVADESKQTFRDANIMFTILSEREEHVGRLGS